MATLPNTTPSMNPQTGTSGASAPSIADAVKALLSSADSSAKAELLKALVANVSTDELKAALKAEKPETLLSVGMEVVVLRMLNGGNFITKDVHAEFVDVAAKRNVKGHEDASMSSTAQRVSISRAFVEALNRMECDVVNGVVVKRTGAANAGDEAIADAASAPEAGATGVSTTGAESASENAAEGATGAVVSGAYVEGAETAKRRQRAA